MSSPERLVQSLLIQLKTFSSTMPHDSSIYMSNYNSPISYSTKDTAADTIDEAHVHFSTEIGFGSYCTNNILPDSTGPSSSSVKPIVSFQDALEAIIEIISEINRDVFIVFDAWEAEKMERQRTPDYIDLLRTIRSAGCRLFLTSRGVAEPKPDPSILFDMSLPINEADIRDDVENLIQRQMSDMLMEYFRILMIPKFAISIEFDRLKNLLGSFDLATLFVSYMRSIVHKSIAFRPQTLLSLTSKAVVRASAPNPLLIQLAGISNFEPERLIRTSTEFFSTGLSSVQARSVLVWLTFAASPILFEDLGTAMRHISDEPQASRILPNLTITKQIRDKESEYEDLRSILIQLDGLIVWDRGSQLTQLSSKEVGSAVKSLWFSAYQSKTILPSVSGLGILGRICIYCIQYILSVPLEDTSIRSEKAANELLQRHSFLSHAVLNWSRYCREFYVLMTDQTHTHEEVSNDLGNQAEFGQHGQDEERGDQYNAQFWLEIAGLRVDTLKHQSQDQNKYLKFLHDEVSARVSDLIEDKPKIFMAILLAVHSRPDLSSFNNSWEELHSWVTSMPELLMTSHLGLDNAVKDEVRKDPGRLYESDQRGNTALHLAARLGFEDVVCTLLSAGVSVKVLNHSGQTPALYAYKYGQTRAFALIFEKMVTDDVLDTASKLTYDYCDYIVGKQGDNQRSLNLSLFHAIEKSQIAIVRHLLDCGADPDAFNNDNTPVLHYAIQYGEESKTKFSYMRSSCFDLLIRYGADPEIQSKDNKMESSLHVAVRWGKLGAIRWLLRYGVDPCQADSEGRSPLFAVFDRKEQISDSKCSEIVSLLVVKGADRNQSDYKGHRALLLAHQSGLPGVVQLLGGLGAYIDSPHAVAKERVEQATD
ncbi:ankyrin repeat-containing domain protein [Xylaria arbuscula]|nr:ankyrin repeat-containing domain protein [Xylaria arbuscula]